MTTHSPQSPEPRDEVDPPHDDMLVRLEAIIRERITDVMGTYCDRKWLNTLIDQLQKNPTSIVHEVSTAVGKGVVEALARDAAWPKAISSPGRPTTITLDQSQVATIVHCCWYLNAAQFAQLRCEREWFPGWNYSWVLKRLRAVGAVVHDRSRSNGMAAAPDLVEVTLQRDGLAHLTFTDRVATVPCLPQVEHCPLVRTRRGKPLEMYGTYLTLEELTEKVAKQRGERRES